MRLFLCYPRGQNQDHGVEAHLDLELMLAGKGQGNSALTRTIYLQKTPGR